ncbi:MAG: hypothetical protein ACK58L_11560 [Planctomycetota bacterium]
MKRASFQMYLATTFLTLLGSSLRANDFEPHVRFNGQLFPSFIISTAAIKNGAASPIRSLGPVNAESDATTDESTEAAAEVFPEMIGDQNGLIGVEITATRSNVPITVTVTCDEVMDPSTFSGQLPKKGEKYLVNPKIRYKFSKLAEVNQATPVSMHFKVSIGGKTSEDTATIMLRPINDCPLVTIEHGEAFDTSSSFAAYVNEQHPFLDKLLREALDIGVVSSFTGYQQDEKEVIRQVYSIWDALVTRDIRYSSITATAGGDGGVLCQHVRLIEESLNNSQANCVDGSVLMASALRKIGIEPFLVSVPGHCYVGFFVDESNTFPLAIETTCLGRKPADEELPPPVQLLEDAINEDHRFEDSWGSFQLALAAGTEDLLRNKERFAAPDENDYLLIHIANARNAGFLPIAFRGKEEFVGNGLVWDEEESEESDEEMMEEEDASEEELADSDEEMIEEESEEEDSEEEMDEEESEDEDGSDESDDESDDE